MSACTLADFLLARIDEDEAAIEAKISGELDLMHRDGLPNLTRQDLLTTKRDAAGVVEYDASWLARPLAEAAAKRRIVTWARVWTDSEPDDPADPGPAMLRRGLRGVLAVLALPYADHADYREEWRA